MMWRLLKNKYLFSNVIVQRKMGKALITVGKDELQAMIDEDHGCELSCQFCNKKYQFSERRIKRN